MKLKDQVAVVTGGSRGIGKGIVEAFAAAGAKVAVVYRGSADAANSLAKDIVERGGTAIAVQCDVTEPAAVDACVERVAKELGLEADVFYADEPADYVAAFAGMRTARSEALIILSAPDFFRDAALLSRLALEAGLPTVCEWASMARDGCLIGYGPNFAALWRRPADYVAQILRGAKPGQLPIEQPTLFEFAVNLKTAKALGLTIPESALQRADEVFE